MTPEEQALYGEQQSVAQQAAMRAALDSGLFAQQEADVQNSRQFYLSYEDLVNEMEHFWRGEELNEQGAWVTNDDVQPIMDRKASHVLGKILKSGLSNVVRLSNFQQEDVKRLAYQTRERISGWLATEGWLKYGIPVSYLPLISHQCELLIYSGLLWGLNSGGQRFMTTNGRTIESVSQVMTGAAAAATASQEKQNKWFKVPKVWK